MMAQWPETTTDSASFGSSMPCQCTVVCSGSFTGNAKDAEAAAEELASSLDGAAGEEWKAAIQKIADACESCHQDFRAKNSEREHQ